MEAMRAVPTRKTFRDRTLLLMDLDSPEEEADDENTDVDIVPPHFSTFEGSLRDHILDLWSQPSSKR